MKIIFDQNKLEKTAQDFHLRFVILHGSSASGSTHPESDFDVAVLGKEEIHFEKLLELHGLFRDIFKLPENVDLDIKSLHNADPLFRHEVVKDGQLLFGNPAEYEEFKAISRRLYEDAGPLFALEEHLARKF